MIVFRPHLLHNVDMRRLRGTESAHPISTQTQIAAAQTCGITSNAPVGKTEALELGSRALKGTKPMAEDALDFKHYFGWLPVFSGANDGGLLRRSPE